MVRVFPNNTSPDLTGFILPRSIKGEYTLPVSARGSKDMLVALG